MAIFIIISGNTLETVLKLGRSRSHGCSNIQEVINKMFQVSFHSLPNKAYNKRTRLVGDILFIYIFKYVKLLNLGVSYFLALFRMYN
jgi:hypothetical protein